VILGTFDSRNPKSLIISEFFPHLRPFNNLPAYIVFDPQEDVIIARNSIFVYYKPGVLNDYLLTRDVAYVS
jgi:hypothetical protein